MLFSLSGEVHRKFFFDSQMLLQHLASAPEPAFDAAQAAALNNADLFERKIGDIGKHDGFLHFFRKLTQSLHHDCDLRRLIGMWSRIFASFCHLTVVCHAKAFTVAAALIEPRSNLEEKPGKM